MPWGATAFKAPFEAARLRDGAYEVGWVDAAGGALDIKEGGCGA